MKRRAAKALGRGAAGYESRAAVLFGEERWRTSLRHAMLAARRPCALTNPFVRTEELGEALRLRSRPAFAAASEGASGTDLLQRCLIPSPIDTDASGSQSSSQTSLLTSLLTSSSDARFPAPRETSNGLLDYFALDAASVLCARSLGVQPGDRVLDMCAAPGGKSLALAQSLRLDEPAGGHLVCNEPSAARRARLSRVLSSYLPVEARRRVSVTALDGGLAPREFPRGFDRVLVDAPCSADRHLLCNAEELEKWSPRRPKAMAKRQLGLLVAALHATRPGGTVVYSTCAADPVENDGVVAKAVKRCAKRFDVAVVSHDASTVPAPPVGVRTDRGWLVLPDVDQGWGVMFFCVLRKG